MKRTLPLWFGLFLAAPLTWAAQVQDVAIPSPSMHKPVPAIVVLPEAYSKTTTSFPVVYLLHGYSSSPRITINMLSPVLENAADSNQTIIVLPDAGYNSWYFDSPVQPERKYETFMTSELVPYIDGRYRTLDSRESRAIVGGSMGGHGALFLASRHTELFSLAGSLSGAVDFRPFPDNWDLKQVLGPVAEFPRRWDENVAVNTTANLKPGELTIYLDVGTEDAFLEVNRKLHRKLLDLHIAHIYVERPGHHDDPYWREAMFYHLEYAGRVFKQRPVPAAKQGENRG